MPRRQSSHGKCTRAFHKLDIFGMHIGFNIEGEKKHRTIFGALYTLFIVAWVGIVLNYMITQIVVEDLDRLPTVMNQPNFFNGKSLTANEGFYFAIGISAKKGYYVLEDQSNWDITEQYVTLTAELLSTSNYQESTPQSFEL